MRTRWPLLLILAVSAMPAVADVEVPAAPRQTVHLDGLDDLARLRSSNPAHYARAQRVLAAANEQCRAGRARIQFVVEGARDVSCRPSLLRTSLPPKVQIDFVLDDVRYIALVAITKDPPRPVRAR